MKTLIITAALTLSALFASAQTKGIPAQHRSLVKAYVPCTVKGTKVTMNETEWMLAQAFIKKGFKDAELVTVKGVKYIAMYK